MKHSAMLKFTIFVVVVVALLLGGCVNVTDPVLSTQDFRSTVRFVNFANYAGASMSVSIDHSTATTATAAFQSASSYYDLPAGSRFWSFSYGGTTDTLHQALTPNTQYTYYSEYEPTNGDQATSYVLVSERRTFTGTVPYPAGQQVVRFINLSSDTAATVIGGLEFDLMTADTSISATGLAFGAQTPYYTLPVSGSPQYMVVGAAGDTLMTATSVAAAEGRYSVVFTGSQAGSGWHVNVFKEN